MSTVATMVVVKAGPDCVLLELFGRWEGIAAAETLAARLSAAVHEGRHALVNLGECEGMDRGTLNALAAAGRGFDDLGNLDLLVFSVPESLRGKLERTLGEEH